MTAVIRERRSRRILVVFGGGSADAGLLRLLSTLIPKSGADLAGVFLEDQTLFRLAGLPFATEISRITSARRPLTAGELERHLKVQARRAERQLRSIAESLGLPWTFRTHRGPLRSAVSEPGQFDWLLLGTARQALVGEVRAPSHSRYGATAERVRPIAVLMESAASGAGPLEAGIDLAQDTGRPLLVFVTQKPAEAAGELAARLRSFGARAEIRALPQADPAAAAAAIRRASPAVLITREGPRGLDEDEIATLRRGLRCPVVVVRSEPPSP